MSLQLHLLFLLYKAKQNSKGLCPLVVRITYQKERRQLATGYSLTADQWKKLQQGARPRDDKLKQVAQFLETMKTKLCRTAHTLELENRMDLETLIDLYLNKPKNNMSLLVLFRMHNEELDKRTNMDRAKATHNKYRYTYDKLQQFIRYQFNKPDILIHKLEPSFIQLFYDYLLLQCRMAHNTISKYCKNLTSLLLKLFFL